MSVLRRLLNVLRVLLEAHLAVARAEAERDFGRVILGVLLVGVSVTCLTTAWLLLHVVVILLVYDAGYSWLTALGAVIGGDVVIAGLLGAVARNQLGKPMLVESRALMKKTVDAMVG